MELKRYDLSCILGCGEKCTVRVGEGEEYVKYADIEKAVKLFNTVKPRGYIRSCQFNDDGRCILFDDHCFVSRCPQCIEIFGGE